MNWFTFLLIFGGVMLVLYQVILARPGLPLAEAKAALAADTAVLIDLREPGEWTATGVAQQAARLPLSDLRGARTQWRPFLAQNKGKKLILYCASGTRSGLAARQLRAEGFDAVNAGSLGRWQNSGWPIHP